MSGAPYTYGRAMAIAQLMRDMRRPVLKAIVEKNKVLYDEAVKRRDESGLKYHVYGPHDLRPVYLYGGDLFIAYSNTIDWVPMLSKLTKYGREAYCLTDEQIASETPDQKQFPMHYSYILKRQLYIESIEGWPTEEEIAAEIAASAEREKRGGGLDANDRLAARRLSG